MGRGGGGGGHSHSSHRSSGGGSHSRSFGGSSSHSSRGGGSSSFRSGGHSSGGYHSNIHIHAGRPCSNHYYYGSYGYGYGYGGNTLAKVILWIVVISMLWSFILVVGGISASSHGSVTSSTVQREALEPYAAFSGDCIDDDADWILNKNILLEGMESFYGKTGVQPALAIYEEINGQKYLSTSEIEDFMYEEYDKLIGHERGVLLLFCEYADSDYYVYYMAGEDAQTVMDSEACDILIDYVHDLYTSDYSDSEYFAAVFEKTGERIMTVTPTAASKIPVVVFGVVVIVIVIAFVKALKQKHKRDAEKAKETERILNSPIDRI